MSESAPHLSRERRCSLRWTAVIAAGFLAMGGTKAAEADGIPADQPASPPEFVIGAQEDSVLHENLAKSQEIAKLIKEAGFNTLKVTMPWTYPSQAEIKNDLKRFQNAAAAARDHELQLMLNLIPGGGSGLGMAPTTASQQRRYKDTLIAYTHAFEKVHPGGHIILEIPNEPNSKTFWKKQSNNGGDWIAPRAVVSTLAKSYWPIKQEAQKLGIVVTLIGGGLASSHNAVGFMKAMGEARRNIDYKGPIMDALSLHPYGQVNNESPDTTHPNLTTVGVADLDQFTQNIDRSFSKGLPIWMTEYAAKTKVPPAKLHLYSAEPNNTKEMITEQTQAEFYSSAIWRARCQDRVRAFILFNVIDDTSGYWPSGGIMYPDGTPKSSYEIVRQAIEEAKSESATQNC